MARNNLLEFTTKNVNMRNFTAPYVYLEYPKYVKLADGSGIVVQNEDEEFAAVGAKEDADEHGTLLAKAKELGLKTHHKMGVETLSKLINEHLGN